MGNMRAIVFGDVGGHYTPFLHALELNGVDTDAMTLPDDLIVVQVGDLVHRGPDGDQAAALADGFMKRYPSQWKQLLGNHEMMHIEGTAKFFNCACSPQTIKFTKNWWHRGEADVALALTHEPSEALPSAQTLITHAGVTSRWWHVGGQKDAAGTAAYLNSFYPNKVKFLDQYGTMMGERRTVQAGPWWAQSTLEVYPSWYDYPDGMPFNQVHGHSIPFDWEMNRWFPGTPLMFRKSLVCVPEQRATILRLEKDGSGSFVGVDPGYGSKQTQEVMPYFTIENVHPLMA